MSQSLVPVDLTPAVPIVQDAYGKWSAIALQAFQKAQALVGALAPTGFVATNFNIPFAATTAPGPYPSIPTLSAFDLTGTDPGAIDPPPTLLAFNPTALLQTLNPPSENFAFTPGQYNDDMLAAVKSTIKSMMAGTFVLPEPAATMLRNRAYDSANREEARTLDQAYSDFAARGFTEPPGLLNRRIAETRDAAQRARMEANRDVYIQDQQAALENLRAGVNAGVQLEAALINLFTAQQQLQLEAAKFGLDMAERIFSARVRLAVAQVEVTQAQAQVYTAQVQAQLGYYHAKIEKYEMDVRRIEVKKDAWLGEVERYKADTSALLGARESDVAVFRARLERDRVTVDVLMEQAKQSYEQLRFYATLAQEANRALAGVQAQLASAAMNAVNVSASLGYNGNESVSWSTNIGGSLDS